MWANRIFVNKRNQVRAGWKIASAVMITVILTIVFDMLIHFIAPGKTLYGTFSPFAERVAIILGVLMTLKLIDERRPRDIGLVSLRLGYRDLIAGLIFGALAMIVIFFVLWGSGAIVLSNGLAHPNVSHFLWSGLLLYIVVGISEEMFFRGYCLNALQQMGNERTAIIGSALLFAFVHFTNPNMSVIGLINIFVIGALFGAMRMKTGNLWMPIGFHIAWNYFQGNIFGFPVSGTVPHGIYKLDGIHSIYWSGGAFGPEGGLVATILIVIMFFVVGKYPAGATAPRRISP